MIRVGFIGRTKQLYDAICLFERSEQFQISFIWTCKDEEYYNFSWKEFEKLARDLKCPFVYCPSMDLSSKLFDADLVVSINFINLIPMNIIEKVPLGVLNAHVGDLPRYKGNACPNWAILNGEEEVVISIHKMDEGLDSGPIIRKERFPLGPHTYIGEVYHWLEDITPKLLLNAAHRLREGFIPQNQDGRSLRTFPRIPEDGQLDFNATIDWNYRLIRASSRPFSGAFCYLNNSDCKVTIFAAKPTEVNYDFSAVSGQIMERSEVDSSFLVAINERVLSVTDYSVDGLSTHDSYLTVCSSLRNRLT